MPRAACGNRRNARQPYLIAVAQYRDGAIEARSHIADIAAECDERFSQ